MLFGDMCVNTFICLSCGESIDANNVVYEKVGDIKVPKAIKDNGKLFKMIVCPHCMSPYLGFVPSKSHDSIPLSSTPSISTVDNNNGEQKKDDFANFAYGKDGKKKSGKTKNKEQNNAKPALRKTTESVKCIACGKDIEVASGHGGTFGTKCDECLKKLLGGK